MFYQEVTRRQNFTSQVEAFFRQHESEWVPASDLLKVGGSMAWRTRVSDARRVFEGEGGVLQNRQQRTNGAVLSEYRYLSAAPQGRDSTVPEPTAFTSAYQTNERLF